ncbi:MAG: GTPase [Campylobacter sp.]|nr:GTPase [Campylobacter sp.]
MSSNELENKAQEIFSNQNSSSNDMKEFIEMILKRQNQKINIMVTGATGCGKSSTINALFGSEVAKVGVTPNPETMDISQYILPNLTIWDSPGLGDSKEKDIKHAKNIIEKLVQKDEKGDLLIDLVLVILDGGSRDLGTSYELINKVIIPSLGDETNRLLVAINQCDMAMKGRGWNSEANKPEPELEKFLNEKAMSVKQRIEEATGVRIIEPVFYSAGYKDKEQEQKPYNMAKLLSYIIDHTPSQKRFAYTNNINRDKSVWGSNDDLKDYSKSIIEQIADSVVEVLTSNMPEPAKKLVKGGYNKLKTWLKELF